MIAEQMVVLMEMVYMELRLTGLLIFKLVVGLLVMLPLLGLVLAIVEWGLLA